MESLSKVFAILFSVAILFLGPVLYFGQKQDQTNQIYVYNETVDFVDTIRKNGYLTKDAYERYSKSLSLTMNIYEIEIVRVHEQYIPEVDENNQLTGNYSVVESNTYSDDIKDALFGEKGIYYFSKDDYVSVKVYNLNESLGGRLLRIFLKNEKKGGQIYVTYGGMIRDENY